MDGYSKINIVNTHKSRSIDFSDFFSFPQTPKLIKKNAQNPPSIQEEKSQIKDPDTQNPPTIEQEDEEGSNAGERFDGGVLNRSGSVSSAIGFQSMSLKRAFSIRRSSSVSESYCRIHDQYMALASPIEDDKDEEGKEDTRRSTMKKHKGGKIFKACKRFFGLQ